MVFRSGISTADALADVTECINDTLEHFLKSEKAFDTIDHDILYQKLENYGIRGSALQIHGSI